MNLNSPQYDDKTSICRFCSKNQIFGHLVILDDVIKLRYELVIGHAIKESKFEFICFSCGEELEKAFLFKKCVLQNEEKLFSIKYEILERIEVEEKIKKNFEYCKDFEENDAQIKCKICGKSTKNLSRHKTIHHKEKPPTATSNTCKLCNKEFVDLDKHTKERHERTIACNICNRLVKNRLLTLHRLQHRDPTMYSEEEKLRFKKHYCKLCNKFVQKLSYHTKMVHLGEKLQCEICGAGPLDQVNYYQHKKLHMNGMFECGLCQKKFAIKLRLRRHMENLHLAKKLMCSHCGKSFGNSSGLSKHMGKVHVEKTIKCDFCDLKFKTIYLKKAHERRVHLKDINLICTECGAVFHSSSALHIHKTKGHEITYRCVCGLECKSKSRLLQHHYSEHFDNKTQRFECICGRSLKGHNVFTRHIEAQHNSSQNGMKTSNEIL